MVRVTHTVGLEDRCIPDGGGLACGVEWAKRILHQSFARKWAGLSGPGLDRFPGRADGPITVVVHRSQWTG